MSGEYWKCFHCGETFTEVDAAREHFGDAPMAPACAVVGMSGRGRPWTKAEIDALYDAAGANVPWGVVATRLGRSYRGVTQAAYNRGLCQAGRAR